ncbi:Pre-mRNA-splicing factor cwf23 [Cladophialophora carrionii]|uniref:Pre-mRNA-splicing factor cwf23 n=1 Tax=Cladophialophora carrionii TaxID=86049 RepID=A0A1C1C8X7_9EURO|nr:Pre-mRNA-splicing factor cwf23 [Cladophialophora carrionii]
MAPGATAVATEVDYYELLSVLPTASEAEIRRAYRKTSLLYHPDKVKPTPETLDKFQLLQTALNILTDADEKRKYDQTREARQRRLAETAALDSRRRQMVEDLEKREAASVNGGVKNGVKRTWTDRELEIKRIQEENRRRREDAMAKKVGEAQARAEAAQAKEEAQSSETIDRSVKVRWVKEGEGLEIDQEALEDNFAVGDVENVVLLKDKKRRIESRGDRKVLLGTAVIVFRTLAIAKKVVSQGPWENIESVEWAAGNANEGPDGG